MIAFACSNPLHRAVCACRLIFSSGRWQKTGANILGVALNRLDMRRNGYYYYYYYYQDEETGERRKQTVARRGIGARLRLPWQRKAA